MNYKGCNPRDYAENLIVKNLIENFTAEVGKNSLFFRLMPIQLCFMVGPYWVTMDTMDQATMENRFDNTFVRDSERMYNTDVVQVGVFLIFF